MKTYSDLLKIPDYYARFEYLKLLGRVGAETFGFDRYVNQMLYSSYKWKKTRQGIIIRDNGNDLGVDGYDITGPIYIHHINPISLEDIELENDIVFDPDNLISTSRMTHEAIHYGDASLLPQPILQRTPYDMCPWRY